MRGIKFRAWHKEYKEMTQSFNLTDNCRLEGTHLDVHNYGDGWGWEQWNFWYLEDVEIMQYTGLKDKNGKEIYEGDIVRHTVNKTDGQRKWDETEVYEIKWEFIRWSIPYAFLPWGKNPKIEIIGNIHQNPELIKEN